MANERKTVMVSSTAYDLPEHRKEVMDACLRQGMFPKMMEHLSASDSGAIQKSLEMVDEADIYVLVLAHRYGTVLQGQDCSVTELEYNRAVERGIPRLCYVIDKTHPLGDFTIDDIDTGENAIKLGKFKEKVGKENIVNFFKSPADLRAHVINGLSHHRQAEVTQFHYISSIPQPPEAYIAHPYTLLQTHRLVGRQKELNLLTNWVTKKQEPIYSTRIMNIVAIGGMGKSALTWKWFNEIASQEMQPLAGRMWWSFYESDATFENFVIRALAYVSRRSIEEAKQIPPSEREEQLLRILDREPYLLVLDGLERILIAYARVDAAKLNDVQIENQKNIRKAADPRAGSFLQKLTKLNASRILVSTRLSSTELETDGGDPTPGSYRYELKGLTDEDAIELWRAFEITGSRDELLPIFKTIEKHPLLIQALAGEIKRYHRAPGDFNTWRKANPKFDPTKISRLNEAMSHVLEFALQGINQQAQNVLYTIAAFRMPANYDTLDALLVGNGKSCRDETELDTIITELEDRGLLGWDKSTNRYDLHPIVRGVVWNRLTDETRFGVLTSLQSYFTPIPSADENEIESIEELTPAIELYNTLVELKLYDEALNIFNDRLSFNMFRLNAFREITELLDVFQSTNQDTILNQLDSDNQRLILATQAITSQFVGNLSRAAILYQKLSKSDQENGDISPAIDGMFLTSYILCLSGRLYMAESRAYAAHTLASASRDFEREGFCLAAIGLTLSTRGSINDASIAIKRALLLQKPEKYFISKTITFQAQLDIWSNKLSSTQTLLEYALNNLQDSLFRKADHLRTLRLQGLTEFRTGSIEKSLEQLHDVLIQARTVNLTEEEIQTLVILAEISRCQGNLRIARGLLGDVWEIAERGPFPLFHADALNVLAQIERDEGNTEKAIEAATKAYRLSWCDGPPYAYHWGLEKAKQHLEELGAPEPEMPPFDESKFEPMPEVDINPKDEFWVDPDKEFDIDDLLK